ncbi:GNAT family N-acetyltransferase [Kineosporia rhizophila]|uniref:GNAT family N-acetyltransferase n=1 Tax=Kineosporia rhizophila TaxID=84633 RepID=UPI000A77CB36|nr:GNAT family N-acetyltransferase [Kineosporia rhizophila]MCE0537766.1 GNAT family N-acetyltransferase [Kineosporia rhizophila]
MIDNPLSTRVIDVTELTELVSAHNDRMQHIDARTASGQKPSQQHTLYVQDESGNHAVGTYKQLHFGADSYEAIWGALHRYILDVRVAGPAPARVFGEVVEQLLSDIQPIPSSDHDVALLLTWPSRDIMCAAPLLRLGFAPVTSLVMRTALAGRRDDQATRHRVRPAGLDDVDWLTDRAERLHQFEVQLGALPDRANLRTHLLAELTLVLGSETDFVLVAESASRPVGFIHGQLPHNAWIESQTSVGPSGYLSRLYVDPEARGQSVGRSLIAAAHDVLNKNAIRAAMLHHTVHNPLAGPLWAEAGYRPMLTTWRRTPQ